MLGNAPGRLCGLHDKLLKLGAGAPLVVKELLGDNVGDTVMEILEITEGLQDNEQAFLLEFTTDLEKAAGLARRARNAETYLDDVFHVLKRQKGEEEKVKVELMPAPPPGCWRSSKFSGDRETSAAAGDAKAMGRWLPRFEALLVKAGAPVVDGVADVSAKVRILCGKTRPGTLRLRVRSWEEYARWLLADRAKVWPDAPADLVDYLQAMVAEAAAKSVISHFAATCHWLFPRTGFGEAKAILEDEFTKQAFGWAALQLDDPKVAIRKAPRLCVGMLVAMEVYVCNPSSPTVLRVAAWMRLVKTYGALRWDDFKRLSPTEVEIRESGLVGRLTRTKTTGIGKKVRELPLFIPRDATVAENAWLEVGFDLLMGLGAHGRDFMLPRPMGNLEGFTSRMASDTDASILCRLLMADLCVPIKKAGAAASGGGGWETSDIPLLDPLLAAGWTNHSERATLTSMLAALGVDKVRRDALGRWSPSGSDDYVRTYKSIVKDLLDKYCRAVSSGRSYQLFDEEDAVADIKKRIKAVTKADETVVESAVDSFATVMKEVARECAVSAPESTPTEVASLPPLSDVLEEDGCDAEAAKYIIVYTRGRKEARLHLADGCWRARRLGFRDFELLDADTPDTKAYNRVCKDCWPRTPIQPSVEETDSEDSESNSGSSDSMTP